MAILIGKISGHRSINPSREPISVLSGNNNIFSFVYPPYEAINGKQLALIREQCLIFHQGYEAFFSIVWTNDVQLWCHCAETVLVSPKRQR